MGLHRRATFKMLGISEKGKVRARVQSLKTDGCCQSQLSQKKLQKNKFEIEEKNWLALKGISGLIRASHRCKAATTV